MVDLSKAKAGDTVVFRCGGRAVIKDIKPFQSMPLYDVSFDGYNDSAGYDNSGSRTWSGGYSLVDITEVIPAPVAFDWKDAKWGQAFKHERHGGRILRYIAKDPCENCFLFSWLTAAELYKVYSPLSLSELTRSPEHDIKEK